MIFIIEQIKKYLKCPALLSTACWITSLPQWTVNMQTITFFIIENILKIPQVPT